jgi:hypothetical protein
MTRRLKLKLLFRIIITIKEGFQSRIEKKSRLRNLGLIMVSYQLPLILCATIIDQNLLTLAKQPLGSSRTLFLLQNGKNTNTRLETIQSRKPYGKIRSQKEWLDMGTSVHS